MGQFKFGFSSSSLRVLLEVSASAAFGSGKVGTWGTASLSPRNPLGLAGVCLVGCGGAAVLPWRLCAAAPLQRLGRCPAPRRSPAPLCRSRAWCGRSSGGGRARRLSAAAAFMWPCARVHPGRALFGKWAGMKLSSQRQGPRACVTWP